jgi:3-oxoacyl-[acyl-carrier-protein] synthase-3
MSQSIIKNCRIAGVSTCTPQNKIDNIKDVEGLSKSEIRKVVSMAGIKSRRVVSEGVTSVDLCAEAASNLLTRLGWGTDSIDCLIFVTQSPDYLLPSSSCILQARLGLSNTCAAFDVGLGCSGYPYGLWLASMMVSTGGHKRVLVLHGETPSLFTTPGDTTELLFGDCGSATAIERQRDDEDKWCFSLHSDGKGFEDLIVRAGGFRNRFDPDKRNYYLSMNGPNIFNFTIKTVTPLIDDTIALSGLTLDEVDYFIFHQSNLFIMHHLMKKSSLPKEKVPIILDQFGNTGGPSIPLTLTQGVKWENVNTKIMTMLLGYGVGLSWGAAMIPFDPGVIICHSEHA